MGDSDKHLSLAREKLKAVSSAYEKNQSTVVGDLATKVVEQLIEAYAGAANAHFGDHKSRHEYSNKNFPPKVNNAMRKIWFAYGDLGYDGINGKRAKQVMENLKVVIQFFEEKLGVNISEENTG
ncbi:hypothetical protein [Desulfonatronospira sp.]|uniref:hypothetical protein n=1 Tax=Desulfonatronospira sp. TaxID=1962951 RepID=UPI0025C46B24|nr:hypothetical protein [Desulfonatronospira sp.]